VSKVAEAGPTSRLLINPSTFPPGRNVCIVKMSFMPSLLIVIVDLKKSAKEVETVRRRIVR
jgi:hypothetical protein